MAPTKTWHGNADLRRLLRPVGGLRTHPRNPRRGNVPEIQESLRRFGQQRAILATPDGTIVAGNHTYRAAVAENWTHIAVTISNLTDAEVDAYLAADNRLAELGGYDDSLLAEMLSAINATTSGLSGTGYDDRDLVALLADVRRRERDAIDRGSTDAVPPTPETPKSKTGTVYTLGPHRLYCGDASDPASYAAALDGAQADLVWTDPPYGIDVVGGSRAKPKSKRRATGHLDIRNDDLTGDRLTAFLKQTLGAALDASRPGANWYVASPSGDAFSSFYETLVSLGLWRWVLVWVKDTLVLSRMDYQPRHEFVLYGWKPGSNRIRPSDRTLTTVMEFPRPTRNPDHPTMKPVELVEVGIQHSSRPDDLVLDPFGGSGTTLIACERLGRRCAMIELDPRYCDVIRRRYADYTGQPEYAP